MARKLLIADQDRYNDLLADSLTIEQALTAEMDSCEFWLRGERPPLGADVKVYDGSNLLFAGTVVKVELYDFLQEASRSTCVWKVTCFDYTFLLDRYLVNEAYEETDAITIVKDIVKKYCPGFTCPSSHPTPPRIDTISFQYQRPSECIKQILDRCPGWDWYVNYKKQVLFFPSATSPSPLTLTPGGPFTGLRYSVSIQDLRNRVYILGGTALSDWYTHTWKADGVERTWVLPHTPWYFFFSIDGIPQTLGIEGVHPEEQYAFMVNQDKKYLRCSKQTPTPPAGSVLSITYRYDMDIITTGNNSDSQLELGSIQGNDGIMEHAITNTSISSFEAAEVLVDNELANYSWPRIQGEFQTSVPGWAPGQEVEIKLNDRNIDGKFTVRRVIITPFTDSEWIYRIEFAGVMLGY